MSTLSKKAWQSRALDAENTVTRLYAAAKGLIEQRDAWRRLAHARSRIIRALPDELSSVPAAVFADADEAYKTLRTLGIDPDKEDGHDA